jgi:hypothetical protein
MGRCVRRWTVNFQSRQLSLFSTDAVQRQFGTIPAYALANISAGVVAPDDKWKLTVQVRNLFNQTYVASIINGGPGAAIAIKSARCQPLCRCGVELSFLIDGLNEREGLRRWAWPFLGKEKGKVRGCYTLALPFLSSLRAGFRQGATPHCRRQ